MLDVALELRGGDGDRIRGCENISQQEFGEGVPAGSGGAPCGVRLECKRTARKLVAHLVVILPVVLEPKPEGVLAVDPRQLVNQLQGVIVAAVRTLGAVAQLLESGSAKRYSRNSPSDRCHALLARYAHGRNDIRVKSQESADEVIEPGVAETGFVYEVGCEGPGVGRRVLFVVGDHLRPRDGQR